MLNRRSRAHSVRRCLIASATVATAVAGWASPSGATVTVNKPAATTPQTNGRVEDIAYDAANDTAYIVGNFTQVRDASGANPVTRNYAAAFRISTGALLPWNPNLDGVGITIAFHPGFPHVYVGGSFTHAGGVAHNRIVDLDPVSGAASSWSPTAWADVKAAVLSPDNTILYVGGLFRSLRSAGSTTSLSRSLAGSFLTSTGAVGAWDPQIYQVVPYGSTPQKDSDNCPPICYPMVSALKLAPAGDKVFIGGTFAFVGGDGNQANFTGSKRHSMALVDAGNGKTVYPFNADVFYNNSEKGSQNSVYDLALLGNQLFVCGDFWLVNGKVQTNITSVDTTTGAITPSFKTSTDGAVNACDVSASTLYLGGHFQYVGGPSQGKPYCTDTGGVQPCGDLRNHVAALNPVTGANFAWNPYVNSNHGVYAVRMTDKVLGMGGEFTTVAGVAHQGYTQWTGTP